MNLIQNKIKIPRSYALKNIRYLNNKKYSFNLEVITDHKIFNKKL